MADLHQRVEGTGVRVCPLGLEVVLLEGRRGPRGGAEDVEGEVSELSLALDTELRALGD